MLKIYYLKWTKIKNKKNFSRYDNFFYKPLKVEINVYPSVFSAKNPVTGKHLSVRRKGFGRLSSLTLSLHVWSDCRPLPLLSAANKKRELKLSSHIILFRSNNQLQKVKRVK